VTDLTAGLAVAAHVLLAEQILRFAHARLLSPTWTRTPIR
jgi:hypothetical protein